MTWGLVLSGGAACGLANAGVIDVLEKHNLRPDYVAGSSMGAIIGALYAMGCPVSTLQQLNKSLSISSIARWSDKPLQNGLHGGLLRQQIADVLGQFLDGHTVGDCRIPFVCLAGEVQEPITWSAITKPGFVDTLRQNVTPYVFPSDTPLIDAVMASSAIPVVFSPVTIGSRTFIDLCHFGAIPSRSLREIYQPDVVIATDTTPVYERLRHLLPTGWQNFLQAGYQSLNESKEVCDLVICPDLPAGPLRFDKGDVFMQAGADATEGCLPAIQKILQA